MNSSIFLKKIFRNGLFPEYHNHNVFLYYIIEIFLNMWFTEAVWYFYWGRFASYSTIGLIFSITSIIQLVMTIPTGVLADMFGQKKSVMFGLGLLFIGSTIIAFGAVIGQLFIGVILQSIGRAFISGALDALIYESLKKEGKAEQYDRVVSYNTQLVIIIFAVTAVMGGWLYAIHFRLAHILAAISYLAAFIFSLFLKESLFRKVHTDYIKKFIMLHKVGFKELILPAMRGFVVPALVLGFLQKNSQ